MSVGGNRKMTTTATLRLKQDYLRIRKEPVPYICAEPLPSNILECLWDSLKPPGFHPEHLILCSKDEQSFYGFGTTWGHFVVRGPEKTPYEGGYYHGKLIFPQEFPFKPPGIYMLTPNGRFMCNTRLCLSISDFHPDTWNPAWSVSTILTALLSFMVENIPTLGSIETSDFTKRQLSAQSLAFNLKDRVVCELFPEVVEEIKVKQRTQKDFGVPPHTGHVTRRKPNLRGALANLCVIAGLVVCVYTVKFVCYIIQARTENRPESSF